jgi:D-xylose transport system substrate-binding protein
VWQKCGRRDGRAGRPPVGAFKIDVPSILLEPIAVDKDNLVTTVIADDYQKIEDVYREIPKDSWPKKALV